MTRVGVFVVGFVPTPARTPVYSPPRSLPPPAVYRRRGTARGTVQVDGADSPGPIPLDSRATRATEGQREDVPVTATRLLQYVRTRRPGPAGRSRVSSPRPSPRTGCCGPRRALRREDDDVRVRRRPRSARAGPRRTSGTTSTRTCTSSSPSTPSTCSPGPRFFADPRLRRGPPWSRCSSSLGFLAVRPASTRGGRAYSRGRDPQGQGGPIDLPAPKLGVLSRLAPDPVRLVLNWGRRYSLWGVQLRNSRAARIEFIATLDGQARLHPPRRHPVRPRAPGRPI